MRRYIRQLRHAHATELINAGVPIEVVRLGHASTETTKLYTLLADNVADAATAQTADQPAIPGHHQHQAP
ncbi:tyrosine-type recombinase/integrase [Streptosporangium sp. NPDC005286]|uniref:tyrosine-type recombinase/integrase n=1 Tax=Streptosporangium sp. NPDC005286 TaxID=3154463 RepID=UPI0033AF38FD